MPPGEKNIFYDAFEHAPVGMACLTADGIFKQVNKCFCSILGNAISADELTGNSIFTLFSETEKEDLKNLFAKSITGNIGSFSAERNLRRSDGNIIPVNITAVLHKNEDQQIFICLLEDISQRKEIERRLLESESKFKHMVHNAPIAITRLAAGKDGYEFVNREFLRQSGYTAEEFANMSREELDAMIHPDDRERVLESFTRWTSSGYNGVHNIQYRLYNKQKDVIWLNAYCFTEKDASGNIAAMDQMYAEITEIKKIEEELKAALSMLSATFESTEDGIMVSDGKGRITNFNRKFADIWKLPEDVIESGDDGKALEFAMSQLKDPLEFITKVKDLYSLPDSVSYDIIEFIDGRLIERYSQPQKIGSSSIGRVWSFRDVTERKLNEMIASASLKEKETLLKEIHHRVKNNLQVVSSLLNLESAFIKDKDDLAIFKDSRSRVRSMALVHEILYKTHNISTIDFKSYIESLVNNISKAYKTENTKIDCLLELEDHINISIDTAIPSGLLINEIITNAYKYAFKGRETGVISVGLNNTDGSIHLYISDNGIGLPDNYGLETNSTLGFQLIKALVNQLEGEINIDRNGGTKYRIVFY